MNKQCRLALPARWTQCLERLATSSTSRAVREGLLWVVPTLLLSSCLVFVSVAGQLIGLPIETTQALAGVHAGLERITPLLISAAIAYVLALKQRLPRLPVAFLCLSNIVVATQLLEGYARMLSTLVVLISLAIPIAGIPILARLTNARWLPSFRAGIVSDNLREALNMVLPGILLTALLITFILLVRTPAAVLLDYHLSLPYLESPYLSGLLLSGLNSLLWFVGIHGYHALVPLFQGLEHAVSLNASDYLYNGSARYILNASQVAAFVFIGGSGATFSLALSLALFCRNGTLRLLGIASLPLAFINVNEMLLFGLPIILNPRLLIPFVISPMLNVLVSLSVISLGLVSAATVALPLNAPMLFNAYLASNGELAAIALQLSLIALGMAIYAPFVRQIDARIDGVEVITVRSLDKTFTRLHEEAALYSYDTVVHANVLHAMQAEENRRIRQISEYDFFLEYQPQICLSSGFCQGCEALLRARDPSGRIQPPGEFLGWLERVGLIKDLDLWVASAAIRQHQQWAEQRFNMPISINVTGYTLNDSAYRQRLVDLLAPFGRWFVVEITESELANDVDGIAQAFRQLRDIGVEIAIDDFGTGYSALSYLHQFEIDKLKIDRSFVIASSTLRGASLLDCLMLFGKRLDVSIIVEGVETDAQIDLLKHEKNLLVQGWYYSRSLSAEAFVAYVEAGGESERRRPA